MRKSWLLAALFAVGCGGTALDTQDVSGTDIRPNGKGGDLATNALARPTGQASAACLNYHGGPVIAGTTNVYIIWYGSWTGDAATTIIPNFLNSIGGSPYFNINTTYGHGIANSVRLAGQYTYGSGLGTTLSDSSIFTIVSNTITGGHLPKDTNALYFVLTSSGIKESSGFCTQYCGWHTNGTISGSDIKYSFVGDPDTQCPSGCEAQTASSPNSDPGADGMASVVAHELEETVTDPDLNAWWNSSSGAENGDTCAWTFGTESTASNGSKYNVTLGGRQYLIQQNLINGSTCSCSMHYP